MERCKHDILGYCEQCGNKKLKTNPGVGDVIQPCYRNGCIRRSPHPMPYECEIYSPPAKVDNVNHPAHYKDRVPGIECIEVTQHFDFCRGNAIKYLWRAGLKGDSVAKTKEDLQKAIWYIQREIESL